MGRLRFDRTEHKKNNVPEYEITLRYGADNANGDILYIEGIVEDRDEKNNGTGLVYLLDTIATSLHFMVVREETSGRWYMFAFEMLRSFQHLSDGSIREFRL